jgi:predicted amidohydrolase YtcJ
MNLYADSLFIGGKIYTADPAHRWAEAVAVRNGRILAVGRSADVAELRGPQTEVTDLAGRLLLPAFTDSHIHFIEVALRSTQVDATGTHSADEVVELVRARVAQTPPGGWILGGGFDANTWAGGPAPHRQLLDAVAPDNPVRLDSKELHSVWVNSAALRLCRITASMPEVVGGVIDRDAGGQPTGILRENAIELLRSHQPAPDVPETAPAVHAATAELWARGIVAIHNANDTRHGLALRTYQTLHREGRLRLRVLAHLSVENLAHARAIGLESGLGDAWLRIGGVKMFADGALGSRTASMLEPFTSDPNNWGVRTMDPEEMLERALLASAGGLTLTIHAIGDRANHDVLNVLAEVRRQEAAIKPGVRRPLRHRIEHVQCIHPRDLPRLAELNLVASVQPIHCTSDMKLVDVHWGPERAHGAYAFCSLLQSGAPLVFGSDAPVEPYAPLLGIHAAVTRRRPDGTPGPEGWHGEQRLTVAEAIDAYTRWPAYAAGEEAYRGTIAVGKVADIIVLGQDLFTVDPMEIPQIPIETTVLDGQVVWRHAE